LPWSELASFVKERFWALVCAKSLRFLHLLKRGTSALMSSTTTTRETNIHRDPPLALGAGLVAASTGVLAVSEGASTGAAGVATSGVAAAGVLTVSAGAASVADGFGARADGRVV
jgi:hypothetical protein